MSVSYTIPLIEQYKTNDETKDQKWESKVVNNPYIYHMSINRDYLPIKALVLQHTYLKEKEDKIYILNGKANIINENKQDLKIDAELENINKDTTIEFPFFYYPGYEAILEIDGNKTRVETKESKNGFVSITINENIEKCNIHVKYVGTKLIYISYIISAISLIIFIIYIIYEVKKGENNVKN